MNAPSLPDRQHCAQLLHELTRPATAAIIAELPQRRGRYSPIDDVHRRSGLPAKEFWTTISRLETLGILSRTAETLLLDHDQLDRAVDALVADSPLNSIMVERPRLRSFVRWGRVTRMPTEPSLLDELYEALADLFESGETLSESAVNDRILDVHGDPAEVRRALVDRGLLRRKPGSLVYVRPWRRVVEPAPCSRRRPGPGPG